MKVLTYKFENKGNSFHWILYYIHLNVDIDVAFIRDFAMNSVLVQTLERRKSTC